MQSLLLTFTTIIMKKQLTLLATVLLIYIGASAQIPNYSFETWTSMGAYSNPANWGTMNNTTAALSVYTATKGSPGVGGAAYLKLTSKKVGTAVVNGIAVSGVLDSMTMKPKSGFAYNLKPTALVGKWQYMASNAGSITIQFTKWNTTTKMRDVIGSGSQTLSGMAMSWASFSIPITFTGSGTPDSCIIILKASGSAPVADDYLWVDNLELTGATSIVKNENPTSFTVYPNPGNGVITLNFNTPNEKQTIVQVMDITGKMMLSENLNLAAGTSKQTLDVSSFAKGSYFIKIMDKETVETKKLIIQ
jgi:hypothetical protein